MKTLVVLTPGFPKDESDTTCLPPIQQFVHSLKGLYPQCKIIVLSFQYPFQKGMYEWNGIKVIAIGGANKPGVKRVLTWLKAFRALLKIKMEDETIGLLSLWLTECALVGKLFVKWYKLKHYVWLQGQDAKKSNRYVKVIRPKETELIAISDFLQREFASNHGVKPFMVVENGINETAFPYFNSGKRTIDVLGVGSLTPLKNYHLFIDVVFELAKQLPGLKAVITGAGEEEAVLKERVRQLRLENLVEFTGLLGHPQVLDLMNQATTFLHTSYYEGNATVLIEALYSGCYTVSTQPLSDLPVKNLWVANTKEELTRLVLKRLENKEAVAEKVTFNTMDESAKRIMALYL